MPSPMRISSILSSEERKVAAQSTSKGLWWIADNIQYKYSQRQRFCEHYVGELKAWTLSEKIIAEFIDEESIFIAFGKRMSINNWGILLLCSFIQLLYRRI